MDNRAVLVLLWAALVAPALGARGFWNPDEGRYGEVAREVWQGDGAVVMHLNGEVYGEKPPLFFWMVAGCQMVAGEARASFSRIPSALATLIAALLLYGLVKRSHGEREGLFAGMIYLSAGLVLQMAQWIGFDALVTALVVACLYCQERAADADRRWPWLAGIYVLLAAIVLTKGAPVIIAVLALAGTAWLSRGPRGLLAGHLLWGIPLFLVLLAAWAVPAANEAGWDYIGGLTVGQAGKRLMDAESHQAPFYYYLLRFPALFLPWALLLPVMVMVAVRDWRAGGDRRVATGPYVLWFVLPFLLFTLISGKRERYILPLFPAAAALAGVAVVRFELERWYGHLVRRPLLFVLGALGLLGLAAAVAPLVFEGMIAPRVHRLDERQMAEVILTVNAGTLPLVAGGLAALGVALEGLLRRRDAAPVIPIAAALAFLVMGLAVGALPAMDRVKSYRPLAQAAVADDPEVPVGLVALQPGPFCLALGRQDLPVVPREEIPEGAVKLFRERPDIRLVAQEKDVKEISEAMQFPVRHLYERRVGRRLLIVFEAGGLRWR
jgi:4-amino-4-deoxy-L-arabinose transferase-like glycosyltransferase